MRSVITTILGTGTLAVVIPASCITVNDLINPQNEDPVDTYVKTGFLPEDTSERLNAIVVNGESSEKTFTLTWPASPGSEELSMKFALVSKKCEGRDLKAFWKYDIPEDPDRYASTFETLAEGACAPLIE